MAKPLLGTLPGLIKGMDLSYGSIQDGGCGGVDVYLGWEIKSSMWWWSRLFVDRSVIYTVGRAPARRLVRGSSISGSAIRTGKSDIWK